MTPHLWKFGLSTAIEPQTTGMFVHYSKDVAPNSLLGLQSSFTGTAIDAGIGNDRIALSLKGL